MKVALFSAFPQELTHIIKNLRAKRVRNSPFVVFFSQAASKEIVIVQSGMGTNRSEAAWNYAVKEYSPDYIISAGFGGAFYGGAKIGDLVAASHVLLYPEVAEAIPADSRLQNYQIALPGAQDIINKMTAVLPVHEGSLVTLGRLSSKSDVRKELLQGLLLPVCDMETFPMAKLSIGKGLPFFAIRAITDRAHEEIPQELFGMTDADGNYSLSRALGIILRNPALVPSCLRMGKNARVASQKLCAAIETLLRIL